jgi:endonuclease-3
MIAAMAPARSITDTAGIRPRIGAPAQPRPRRHAEAPVALERRTVGRVLRLLRREAPGWNAPVMALEAAEHGDPFRVLIGCILSLRTRDETTAEAAPRLFAAAAAPSAMLALGEDAIARLIYPVGFYRTKAAVIVGICRELISRFGSRVPDSIDALLTLKGVGRKTANLVVTQAYGKPGICVDTHVHRISNRWGLVGTRTPDETEAALRVALPPRYWIEYNTLLVAFGQTICQPLSPWCSRCPATRMCPRRGVTRAR